MVPSDAGEQKTTGVPHDANRNHRWQGGGLVWRESLWGGEGSEFVVRLPALPKGYRRAPVWEVVVGPREAIRQRVLVVDDNVDAAESMAMLVRLWGHEVRLAHTGPEALDVAGAYQPEIVVLDIGLPGMNGYEVARQLRQQPRFQQTLLVALTGYGQEDDRRRSTEAGFNHHLTKPVEPDTLAELLAKAPSSRR
jgi:two-component system CheB/CheR fusion protein